jgi:hypothetical protein
MLTKTTGYLDSAGNMHATVEAAQKAELYLLLGTHVHNTAEAADVADAILANADAIIAILTTGPRSKAKARKTPGTTNPTRALARVSLDQTLQQIRDQYGWTDAELVEGIHTGKVLKLRGIGEQRYELLKQWAKKQPRPQPATEAEAQAGFTAMREAANGELVPAAAD